MVTSNEVSNNDADMLKYLVEDKNTKKNDTPLSQLYHMQPPVDEDTTKEIKKRKHRWTNFDAGFEMRGEFTECKSLPSVQGSIPEQSFNTSKYSRRVNDYAEVLLTWDETAERGLKKEEQ